MANRFHGKVALVTGAAGGIGRASALAFAREGAKVVVSDIAAAGAQETVGQIEAAGGEAFFVKADVADAAQVEALVRTTIERFGRLDCAHNNAGVEGSAVRTADCTEEDWQRTLAINLTGVWLCMKREIPHMLAQGGGAIVNTASVAGVVGHKMHAAYSASKHGIIGLTKSAALDYARAGMRINAVCPGLIDTEMVERAITASGGRGVMSQLLAPVRKFVAPKILVSKQPAGRMGLPDEVAQAVMWLCSEEASFVNGHALIVDGGFVAK